MRNALLFLALCYTVIAAGATAEAYAAGATGLGATYAAIAAGSILSAIAMRFLIAARPLASSPTAFSN